MVRAREHIISSSVTRHLARYSVRKFGFIRSGVSRICCDEYLYSFVILLWFRWNLLRFICLETRTFHFISCVVFPGTRQPLVCTIISVFISHACLTKLSFQFHAWMDSDQFICIGWYFSCILKLRKCTLTTLYVITTRRRKEIRIVFGCNFLQWRPSCRPKRCLLKLHFTEVCWCFKKQFKLCVHLTT